VVGGRARHVYDRVQLGEVRVPVEVDDGGEGLKGGGLDLHEVLALHLQHVHKLLQQARVEERLDRVRQLVTVDQHRQRLQPGLDGLEPGPVVGEAVGQAHVREQQHLLLLRHLMDLQEVLHDGGRGLLHLVEALHVDHRHAGGLRRPPALRPLPPLRVELEVERGGRGGEGRDQRVRAAHRQAEPVVLSAPAGGEVGEAREEQLALVRGQPGYEVRPLAEHVEEVEHSQHHVQVEAGEEEAEVLHGAVEVAGEAVLDEQGGEVERPQHELLEVPGRLPRLVAGQHPRPRRVRGRLFEYIITEVEDIYPVVELAFPVCPGLYPPELGQEVPLAAPLQLLYERPAVRRHLARGLLELGPVYLHPAPLTPGARPRAYGLS